MEKSNLSSDQEKIIDLYLQGKNLFISGGAGTGKSYILNYLKNNFSNCGLQITASTGIAAVNINGSTIHSWSGIGLANQPLEQIINNLYSSKFSKIRKKIINTKSLAIDEISMISAETFDILDNVFKEIRQNDKPFGGLQVLFFGDFLQLPPINKKNNKPDFCFNSNLWSELNLNIIILDQVFRQTDKKFIKLLNNIRFGLTDDDDIKTLKSRIKYNNNILSIKPTILTTHNLKVEDVNNNYLKKIPHPEQNFEAKYDGNLAKIEFLKKNCLAYPQLRLKVGAQVMMIKNSLQKEGIINGSLGIVRDFSIKKNYPVVEFANGKTLVISPEDWILEKFDPVTKTTSIEASITQIPLILAWAITIHKSQGLTLDKISCDLSQSFSPGQVYVALSRARNLEGIFIDSIDFSKINADQDAVSFYKRIS